MVKALIYSQPGSSEKQTDYFGTDHYKRHRIRWTADAPGHFRDISRIKTITVK